MVTESDIESSITLQLAMLGWQPDPKKTGRNVFKQSPKTPEEKTKLKGKRPDYILYALSDSNQATVVIEAKKPKKPLFAALEQAKSYCVLLGAPVALATDGYRIKTWHMGKNMPLLFNGLEVDELFGCNMAALFAQNNIYDAFVRKQRVTKRDLIGKFKKANAILRAEGLEAGIVRFSEFANLMFLKIQLESGGTIAGNTWDDLVAKHGNPLLEAIKAMFAELKKEHDSVLFEEVRIRSPQSLEKLVGILSSFNLTDVRGDIKGMAFEHFIHSYTQGLTNDLGQYFTPRHIIKLMVDYLRPQLQEKIYDPFCGTGGMLIECFKYMKHMAGNERDLRLLREQALFGCDNSSASRIAMMNMIMFGDGHSNIVRGDSYKRLNENKGKYDIVVTNIPFSQETEFHEGYPVPPVSLSQNGDSIGVQHCLESLKAAPTSRAAIVVPIGFLYKDELAAERKYLHNNFNLDKVVELTPNCFNPYTSQQTAILLLRRGKTKSFAYHSVKNDGFSQDGYRTPLPGSNDMDDVVENIGGVKRTMGDSFGSKLKNLDIVIPPRHVRLSEVAECRAGNSITPKTSPELVVNGTEPILMVADLAELHIDYWLNSSKYALNRAAIEQKKPYLFPSETIVIPSSGKAVLKNHRAILGMKSYLTGTLIGIIAKKIHPYCLFYFFLNFEAESITYDLGYPGLGIKDVKAICIPRYSSKQEAKMEKAVSELVKLHKEFKKRHASIISTGGVIS